MKRVAWEVARDALVAAWTKECANPGCPSLTTKQGLPLVHEIERLQELLTANETAIGFLRADLADLRGKNADLRAGAKVYEMHIAALEVERDKLRAAGESDAQDARRWRSLLACKRIRFIGGAYVTPADPDALIAFEFFRRHPDYDDAVSRKLLIKFTDEPGPDTFVYRDGGVVPGNPMDLTGMEQAMQDTGLLKEEP